MSNAITTQNWPDPKRPGVPMFPERDGFHVLKWSRSPALEWDKTPETRCSWEIWEWNSDAQKWGIVELKGMVNEGYEYISPVLTPTQINEMLAAERERAAKEAQRVSDKYYLACEKEPLGFAQENCTQRMLGAAECAKEIRTLGAAL